MTIRFSQKITGERKLVMLQVAEAMDTEPVRYLGPPTFAYQAGEWIIDRDGVLTSPFFADEQELCRCMSLVAGGGFSAEGLLTVVIRSDSEEEESCRENMEAILRGKKSLLRKAIGADSAMAVTITAGGEQAAIFPATLDFDELLAAAQFLICLHTQAAAQKQVRVQDRPVENEKYAMRCFLLRIGMIGTQYKASRRILLRDLEGNSSFKSGARRPRPDAGEPDGVDVAPVNTEAEEPAGVDVAPVDTETEEPADGDVVPVDTEAEEPAGVDVAPVDTETEEPADGDTVPVDTEELALQCMLPME